jgi:hypothetical protein
MDDKPEPTIQNGFVMTEEVFKAMQEFVPVTPSPEMKRAMSLSADQVTKTSSK